MVDIIQFLKDQRKAELDQLVGFPTIDHQVEIVSTTVEVGRAIIETTGDTVPRTPLTRTTAANCTSSPLQEMLQVQLSETSTTSWTVTSDAEFTQEVEFNVEGDVLVAGGSAGGSVSASIGVSLARTNTADRTVAVSESVTITVPPQKRGVIEGQTWSTPVSGRANGVVKVRYFHSCSIDFPFFISSNVSVGRTQIAAEIPFTIQFTSELITFSKVARETDVNCDQVGMLLPGDEGSFALDNPLYASLATPADPAAALASVLLGSTSLPLVPPAFRSDVAPSRPGIEGPSSDLARLELVLAVASEVSSPAELMTRLGWAEREALMASYVLDVVRDQPNLTAPSALELGLVRPSLLRATRI